MIQSLLCERQLNLTSKPKSVSVINVTLPIASTGALSVTNLARFGLLDPMINNKADRRIFLAWMKRHFAGEVSGSDFLGIRIERFTLVGK